MHLSEFRFQLCKKIIELINKYSLVSTTYSWPSVGLLCKYAICHWR